MGTWLLGSLFYKFIYRIASLCFWLDISSCFSYLTSTWLSRTIYFIPIECNSNKFNIANYHHEPNLTKKILQITHADWFHAQTVKIDVKLGIRIMVLSHLLMLVDKFLRHSILNTFSVQNYSKKHFCYWYWPLETAGICNLIKKNCSSELLLL
jgi:hypothetical protein